MPAITSPRTGGRLLVVTALAAAAPLLLGADWPTYMHDAQRSGAGGDTTLSPANAAHIAKLWAVKTAGVVPSSATVVGGVAYVGSWDGNEYAINAATGTVRWKTFLGQTVDSTCNPQPQGITSTATVQNSTVYVGGGDSNWYALDASTGNVLWKVFTGDNSPSGGHYNWSSPLIYNGDAYIGVASNCDQPLVQGQLLQVDLTTHLVVHTFNVVPSGQVGGGIWTSPSVDAATNTVYVMTGNEGQEPLTTQPLTESLVALDAAQLTVKASWQIPTQELGPDFDWGTSPVLYSNAAGNSMVAAADKNGVLYAFNRSNVSAGPVWRQRVAYADPGVEPQAGGGTLSTGDANGSTLYWAGGNTSVTPPGAAPLLSDNFEQDTLGQPPAGWTVAGGTWTVAQDTSHVASQTSTSSNPEELVAGSAGWTDYTVSADVKAPANPNSFGITARRQDANNWYQLLLKQGNLWYVGKMVGGTWTTLAQGTFAYTAGTWYHLALTVSGQHIAGSINGTPLQLVAIDGSFSSGGISLRTHGPIEYDNVVVTPKVAAPGSVRAIDGTTGNVIWEHAAPGVVIQAIAYDNGLVADGGGATVEVLDASSGSRFFGFATGGPIFGPPSFASGEIFAGSTDGNEYAFGLPSPAPAVSLNPGSLTFAGQTVGTTSPAQQVTLTNSGTADLHISTVGLTGADPGDFAESDGCAGTTVAAGSSCAVSVTFKPQATGTRTATVSIADDAQGSPQTVALSGNGLGATLFSDNFEADPLGSPPAGWTVAGGTWTVTQDATHVLSQTSTTAGALDEIVAGSTAWTDYTLQVAVKAPSGSDSFGIAGRRTDAGDNYQLLLKLGNLWYLGKRVAGNWVTLATGTFTYTAGTWYTFTLTMKGTTISGAINGTALATATDTSFSSGAISLRTRLPGEYDSVLVSSS
jgi:hypothetical protein